MAKKYEQYMLDESGEEMNLVPMEKATLKPRGSSAIFEQFMGSNYPDFLMEVQNLGLTIQDHSISEMRRGLIEYLKLCERYQKPVTNQAMYTAMGLTQTIVYDITHGRSGNKEQRALIIYAKQLCSMHREAMGVSGTINPLLTIFWQKAYDGLNETIEVTGSMGDGDITSEDAETIAEKYAQLPD